MENEALLRGRVATLAYSTEVGEADVERVGGSTSAHDSAVDSRWKIESSRRSGAALRSASSARTRRPAVAGLPRGNCRLLV
jgi:hypothetical protein